MDRVVDLLEPKDRLRLGLKRTLKMRLEDGRKELVRLGNPPGTEDILPAMEDNLLTLERSLRKTEMSEMMETDWRVKRNGNLRLPIQAEFPMISTLTRE